MPNYLFLVHYKTYLHLCGCVTDNQVPTQNMYDLQAISNDSALEDEEGTAAAQEE